MIWLSRVIFLLLLSPGEGHTRKTLSEVVKRNPYPVDPHGIQILSSDQVSQAVKTDKGTVFDGPEWDGTVYRGDARTPAEIKAQDGFHPRPGPDEASKYSIYSHVKGNIQNTGYVSTTSDVNRAGLYAGNSLKAPGHEGKTVSYVYQIQANKKNYVGVNKSLRLHNVWSNQEHVAMGGVPWSEVKGYAELTREQLDSIRASEKKVGDFVTSYTPNGDFIESSLPGSSARPELAGWPKDSTAWSVEPWRRLKARNEGEPPNTKQAFDNVKASCGRLAKRDGPCLGNPSEGERFGGTMSNEDFARAHGTADGSKTKVDGPPKVKDLAEIESNKRFSELVEGSRFKQVANKWTTSNKGIDSLSAVRTKLIKPKLLKSLNTGLKNAAAGPVEVAIWGYTMATKWDDNLSDLDKAALITSIVPLLGCAMDAAAKLDKGDYSTLDGVDTALCLIGDALLLSSVGAPLGVLVHVFRAALGFFEVAFRTLPKLPTLDEAKRDRDTPWTVMLDNHLYKYIVSESFVEKVRNSLAIQGMAVMAQAADSLGLLNATYQVANEAYTGEDRSQIEPVIQRITGAQQKVLRSMRTEIVRSERQALLNLSSAMQGDSAVLTTMGSDFKCQYIRRWAMDENFDCNNINGASISEDVVDKYERRTKWRDGSPDSLTDNKDGRREARRKLRELWNHLWNQPLPGPDSFFTAFLVGTAAAWDEEETATYLKDCRFDAGKRDWVCVTPDWAPPILDPLTLDMTDYLKMVPRRARQTTVVRYTLRAVRRLRGKDPGPVPEAYVSALGSGFNHREFELLTAMKVGQAFSVWRFRRSWHGPRPFYNRAALIPLRRQGLFESTMEDARYEHPNLTVKVEDGAISHMETVSYILALTKEVVQSLLDQENKRLQEVAVRIRESVHRPLWHMLQTSKG